MKELKYTYIDFIALKSLDISINEYILCDIVYKLQAKEGFCYASNEYFASCLNITERGIINMMKRLIQKGLIDVVEKVKGRTNKIIVAKIWHDTVIFSNEQSSQAYEQTSYLPVNKVHTTTEQSSHYNNTYNNTYINKDIIPPTKVVGKSKASKSKSSKPDVILTPEEISLVLEFRKLFCPAENTGTLMNIEKRGRSFNKLLQTYPKDEIISAMNEGKKRLGIPYQPQITSMAALVLKFETLRVKLGVQQAVVKPEPEIKRDIHGF